MMSTKTTCWGSDIFIPGWLVALWKDGQKDKALVQEFKFYCFMHVI